MKRLYGLSLLLLLLLSLLLATISTAGQFTPDIDGGDGGADDDDGGAGGATGVADDGSVPPINNGAFDLSGSSTGSGFGWQLPDYPPDNITYGPGDCQFVPKWASDDTRCPAGFECMNHRASSRMHDGQIALSYRQEHCVFCAATEFCTNDQKDACKELEVLTDFETFSLINETSGVGQCQKCKEGQFCPSGASNPFALSIVNLCPEGWFCPVSHERHHCPVGFFCPPGTKFPLACTITGTFCPLGSKAMDELCPGGRYCPDPQTSIECPSGYFCKAGSTTPKKCQAMASCPAGSAAALIVWQGILEVVALYVGFALIYYGVLFVQRRRREKEMALVAKRSEGKEVAELLKSLKSFQNLEIREGFSPRQAQLRAESAVLSGAAGEAAAEEMRKLKSKESADGNTTATATATGGPATRSTTKDEPEPGEKSDDDEVQQLRQHDIASPIDGSVVPAAAAVAAAAAMGASHGKVAGTADPKQVSIVLPAEQAQSGDSNTADGSIGTAGGNFVTADGTPLPNSRPLPHPRPIQTDYSAAAASTAAAAAAAGTGACAAAFSNYDECDEEDDDDDDDRDELEGFDPVPCPVTISFHNLGLKLDNGSEILKGVSGEFPHSRLTALMGPSGSGKSTFLNVLCGKATYGKQTGSIRLNGVETTLNNFRSLIAFVPQDDVLHGDLTCYENLYYNAMLRLPRHMPHRQKKRIVDDVVRMLGLEAVQHSVVGSPEARGISGGQRKRVSIGMELVACPTLLFMDEPTSGLDSTASLEVLSALRDLTALGLSIVTVIHQPRFSIVELFHSMLLLGKGGRTVFLGNSEQALNYFSDLGFHLPPNENPADFFLDVISGEVRRDGDPDFQPNDLFTLWEKMGDWVRRDESEPPHRALDGVDGADHGADDEHNADREVSRSRSRTADVEPHFIYLQPRTPAGHLMSPHSQGARSGSSAPPPALNVMTPSHNHAQQRYFNHTNPLSTRTNVRGHGPQRSLSLAANSGGLFPGGAHPSAMLPPSAPMGYRSQTTGSAYSGCGDDGSVDTFHVGRFNNLRMFPPAAATAMVPSGIGGAHRRTRSLYNAVSAYRAGVTSASELPLPKHREMLQRLGKDGIGKLLEEYEQSTRPHSTKHSARGHKSPAAHFPRSGAATPAGAATPRLPAASPARDRTLHPSASTRRLDILFEPLGQSSTRNLPFPRPPVSAAHRRTHTSAHQQMLGSTSNGSNNPHFLSPNSSLRDGRQRSAADDSASESLNWPAGKSPMTLTGVGIGSHSPLITTPNASPVPSAAALPPPHVRTASEMGLGGIQEEDEISPPAVSGAGATAAAAAAAAATQVASSPQRDADGVIVPASAHEVDRTSDSDDLHVKFYNASPDSDGVAPSADAAAVTAPDSKQAATTGDNGALATFGSTGVPTLPSAEGDLVPPAGRAKSPPSIVLHDSFASDHNPDPITMPSAQEMLEVGHTGTDRHDDGNTTAAAATATGDARTDQMATTKTGSPEPASKCLHTPGVLPTARDLPWIPEQFSHLLQRQGLKCLRGVSDIVFDAVLTTAVGLAIGLIFGGVWSLNAYGNICVLAVLALGVLSCVSALKMFGNDRIVFWRESSAGINITAYWLAVTLLHLPFTLIFSFLYTAPYYNLILPGVPFVDTWWVMIGVHFACSGGGMLLSVCFAPISALLSGVMLPLIIGGFLNGVSPALSGMSATLEFFASLSYSRYAVEALMLQELHSQPSHAHSVVEEIVDDIGFDLGNYEFCIGMLFTIGCVLRVCTLLALHGLNRDKRV